MNQTYLFLLFVIFNLSPHIGKGQVMSNDQQWLILDSKGKSGFSGQSIYNQNLANNFSIQHVTGVVHPKGRNDIFAIWGNGYFNGRYEAAFQYDSADSCYNFNTTLPPTYVYYTNAYEGDDPPAHTRVAANEGSPSSVINPVNSNKLMELNHNPVKGKDITLIVKKPKNLERDCGSYQLSYNNSIVVPSNLFNDKTKYCFNCISPSIIGSTNAINFQFGSSDFAAFNFYVHDGTKNDTIRFDLFCGLFTSGLNNPSLSFVTDTLGDSHDPNYIELLSIMNDNGEYWAHYHVECYNDGEMEEDSVAIEMTLPNTVDASTFKWVDWRAGDRKGADNEISKSISNNHLSVRYKAHTLIGETDPSIIHETQKAWFEFVVKINEHDRASLNEILLKPISPMTHFGSTPYEIMKYIDACHEAKLYTDKNCERQIVPFDKNIIRSTGNKWCWLCLLTLLIVLFYIMTRRFKKTTRH